MARAAPTVPSASDSVEPYSSSRTSPASRAANIPPVSNDMSETAALSCESVSRSSSVSVRPWAVSFER